MFWHYVRGVLLASGMIFVTSANVLAAEWTGFYAGLHAGYGWGDVSNTLVFNPFLNVPPAAPTTFHENLNGFIGGGQTGYNYQLNNMVLGIEADISYTHFTGSAANSGIVPPGGLRGIAVPFTYTQNQELDWLGTVRGRVGFTPINNWLVYGTGGLAYGGVKASTTFNDLLAAAAFIGSASTTKTGWTLGGGAEFALMNNFTAKLEYLYYDLGRLTVVGIPTAANVETTMTSFAFRGNIIRVGLNYKFGSR
jgi:outer membrane immunogenic protein